MRIEFFENNTFQVYFCFAINNNFRQTIAKIKKIKMRFNNILNFNTPQINIYQLYGVANVYLFEFD